MLRFSYIIPVTQSSAYACLLLYPTARVTHCHHASAADADPSLSYLHCECWFSASRGQGLTWPVILRILVPGLLWMQWIRMDPREQPWMCVPPRFVNWKRWRECGGNLIALCKGCWEFQLLDFSLSTVVVFHSFFYYTLRIQPDRFQPFAVCMEKHSNDP
jgi:hypothetical protein